jgi:hypothetical protein
VLKSTVVIFTVGSFLNYWACLYAEEDAEKINVGAKLLINKATMLARVLQENAILAQPSILAIHGPSCGPFYNSFSICFSTTVVLF